LSAFRSNVKNKEKKEGLLDKLHLHSFKLSNLGSAEPETIAIGRLHIHLSPLSRSSVLLPRLGQDANYTDACGNWLMFSHQDRCFLKKKEPFSNDTMTLPALYRICAHIPHVRTQEAGDLTVCKLMFYSSHLTAAFAKALFRYPNSPSNSTM
jgi:hypothetical protein